MDTGAETPVTVTTTPPARPSGPGDSTRVLLRPLATPLPLGFLALAVATLSFAAAQLGWVPASEGRTVALGVMVLTVPLQLLAAVMGFLARDPVAATGMAILSGTWGAVCLSTLTSPPGAHSPGLGILLVASATCLLVPAAAATSKLVPALVIATSATRFAVTGVAHLDGGQTWMHVAGWVGVVLAALSLYAALALELEGARSRTVLPLGRRGPGREALTGDLRVQTAHVDTEPGVRQQL